jgi:hypothetical protein
MKQKIKEAITQGYKNLGVPESVVDGLTALGVTVVKDESEIDAFVQGEAVKGVMKSWQSEADKVRTKASDSKKAEYEAKIAELEAKLNGNQPPEPNPEPKPQGLDVDALVDRLNAAWEQKLQPLQEKLNAFETAKTAELAVKQAQEKFGADEWVNGYPELRDSAWAQAMRIYDRTGKSMTADELHTEAMEIFKPLAKAKGLDISKPFQSDGGAGEGDADFSSFDRAAKELGWTEPEK